MTTALAHPGRTASDGCHYCRTNCSSWGVAWDQRHCHGGYTTPPSSSSSTKSSVSSQPKQPSCPSNSYYNSLLSKCSCNAGYAVSLSKKTCVKIPENAHIANNGTDVWLCDEGYEEKGNTCIEILALPEVVDIQELNIDLASTNRSEEETKDAVTKENDVAVSKSTTSNEGDFGAVLFWLVLVGGAYLYGKKRKKN